jgi:hypothetical protein
MPKLNPIEEAEIRKEYSHDIKKLEKYLYRLKKHDLYISKHHLIMSLSELKTEKLKREKLSKSCSPIIKTLKNAGIDIQIEIELRKIKIPVEDLIYKGDL